MVINALAQEKEGGFGHFSTLLLLLLLLVLQLLVPLPLLQRPVLPNSSVGKQKKKCPGSSLSEKSEIAEEEEDGDGSNSQSTASDLSFERKVTRTRSVGCGSRWFSADLFERISAGFGQCSTLRRVESQREGKSKVSASNEQRGGSGSGHNQKCMKERVKCGGIFAGFIRI